MILPSIKNINIRGKRVLLRAAFNVPMENGKVTDDFRLHAALPTMELLKNGGAKVIVLSHISEGRADSLRPVAEFLGIGFSDKVFGAEVKERIAQMGDGEVLLLENLRSDSREEKNDIEFARGLAELGDVFVNDDFGTSHREHASIVGLPTLLPSYAGLQFEKEMENLQGAFHPDHPFLLVLGGIKFESKLGVLDKFVDIADKIFVGGALSNNFFKLQGKDIGTSFFDDKVDISKFLDHPKIVLPLDTRVRDNRILDCGPKTIEKLAELAAEAKFILWNGPLGDFEHEFGEGTEAMARIIADAKAKTIIGGGDTVAAVRKLGVLGKISFVSTAGGAMLEFLAKGTLPGIEALEKNQNSKIKI